MPPLGSITGVNWFNQNSLRKYPLSDAATCVDTTNSFTLPNDLIVDLVLPVISTETYDPDGFHLSEVAVFGQGIVLAFAYTDPSGPTTTEIGRVSVSSSHVKNSSYYLSGVGNFSSVVGIVTIGEIEDTLKFGGVFQFDVNGGRLVSTCIRPDIRGVTSLRVRNGSEVSDPLYGDIELVAGANISLEVSGQTIRINAINSAGLDAECSCLTDADRQLPEPIRTINGVPAASNGNFQISATGCLSISGVTAGIRIEDTCAKPCCTSVELQRIVTDMNTLSSDVRSQGFTMSQLETRLSQLSSLAQAIAATGFIV